MVCFLSSIMKIMHPSGARLRQVCLQPIIKDAGSLCLRSPSCETNQQCTQHPPEPLCISPWDAGGGKGTDVNMKLTLFACCV